MRTAGPVLPTVAALVLCALAVQGRLRAPAHPEIRIDARGAVHVAGVRGAQHVVDLGATFGSPANHAAQREMVKVLSREILGGSPGEADADEDVDMPVRLRVAPEVPWPHVQWVFAALQNPRLRMWDLWLALGDRERWTRMPLQRDAQHTGEVFWGVSMDSVALHVDVRALEPGLESEPGALSVAWRRSSSFERRVDSLFDLLVRDPAELRSVDSGSRFEPPLEDRREALEETLRSDPPYYIVIFSQDLRANQSLVAAHVLELYDFVTSITHLPVYVDAWW